jgi:hypothetical protein
MKFEEREELFRIKFEEDAECEDLKMYSLESIKLDIEDDEDRTDILSDVIYRINLATEFELEKVLTFLEKLQK